MNMTNDTNFNAKSNPTPSIMEPIDETPSLTLTVWLYNVQQLIKETKRKQNQTMLSSNRVKWSLNAEQNHTFRLISRETWIFGRTIRYESAVNETNNNKRIILIAWTIAFQCNKIEAIAMHWHLIRALIADCKATEQSLSIDRDVNPGNIRELRLTNVFFFFIFVNNMFSRTCKKRFIWKEGALKMLSIYLFCVNDWDRRSDKDCSILWPS